MDCFASCSTLWRRRNGGGLLRIHLVASRAEFVNCQILLEHGAGVNAVQEDGWTALHIAARYGDAEMVKVR